jgi:hypothetical protein
VRIWLVGVRTPARRSLKSDGLIGEASTRTNTSFAEGMGIGTSCSDTSSMPCDVTNERSSSTLSGRSAVIGSFAVGAEIGKVVAHTCLEVRTNFRGPTAESGPPFSHTWS